MSEEQNTSELDQKLNRLYKNIKGTPEQTEKMKSLIQKLAEKSETGYKTVMEMPENVSFNCVSAESLRSVGGGACYSDDNPNDKMIKFSTDITDDEKTLLHYLAHEMRHAIQDADGRFNIHTPYPSQYHAAKKLCELETKLQDIVIKRELLDLRGCEVNFYTDEFYRIRLKGKTDEEAKKEALTNIARLYWSRGQDVPEGCNVPNSLRREIERWNSGYDRQTLVNRRDKNPNALSPSIFATAKAIRQKEEEAKNEEKDFLNAEPPLRIPDFLQYDWLKAGKTNTAPGIIKKYIKEMGIDVPPTYFTKTLRESATIGDTFVTNYYPDKTIESKQLMFPEKISENKYEPSRNGEQGTLKDSTDYHFSHPKKTEKTGDLKKTLNELQLPQQNQNKQLKKEIESFIKDKLSQKR